MSRDEAEEIATTALGYVASDGKLLSRFLALTGIEPSDIRSAAAEPGFLAGVLQFILAHPPTLAEFIAASELKPERIDLALRTLPHGDYGYERST